MTHNREEIEAALDAGRLEVFVLMQGWLKATRHQETKPDGTIPISYIVPGRDKPFVSWISPLDMEEEQASMRITAEPSPSLAKHTPGPWKVDSHTLGIWAPNAKIGGETKIFDIRGWGYLTGKGHGALGLSTAEAGEIQRANGQLASQAPALAQSLKKLLEVYWQEDGETLPKFILEAQEALKKAGLS